VRLHTRVEAVQPEAQKVVLASGETVPFDSLVMATGAAPRLPEVPGLDIEGIFTLRNLADALRIKRFIRERRARRAVAVGAGFVALEMCEAFRGLGLETTVLESEARPVVRLPEDFSAKIVEELQANGVTFMPQIRIEGFERSPGGIVVRTESGTIETDLVLVAIGVKPEVRLAAEAGVALGETGAIAVNDRQQTNLPFAYAAGDCCESYHRISRKQVYIPLGDTANKQGRVAGANIGGQEVTFPGILGSHCFKVFGLEVAGTGLNEDEARKAGLAAAGATIQGVSRAHSYPSTKRLWLRLVADRGSGRLVGAQAVGGEGVVARINILAGALAGGLSIEEVAYLDLAYAPPFSGSWDPIHIAAQQLLK
jgi:NADPH-dependent 2,4-dienoyl-CoA reductase/sulfur reductase-like enzyme